MLSPNESFDGEALLQEVDLLNSQIAYYKQRVVDVEVEVRNEVALQIAQQIDETERELEAQFQKELQVRSLLLRIDFVPLLIL